MGISLVTVLFLLFNLVIVPISYPDQTFDGVDNVLRYAGVSEAGSREIVSGLYDLTR